MVAATRALHVIKRRITVLRRPRSRLKETGKPRRAWGREKWRRSRFGGKTPSTSTTPISFTSSSLPPLLLPIPIPSPPSLPTSGRAPNSLPLLKLSPPSLLHLLPPFTDPPRSLLPCQLPLPHSSPALLAPFRPLCAASLPPHVETVRSWTTTGWMIAEWISTRKMGISSSTLGFARWSF